jgi:hypothetical protein
VENEPVITDPVYDENPVCSAKGCRATAVWVLAWNNPKLHTPERRKTWIACEEHRESLGQFLGVRGFLKDVVALEEWRAAHDGPGAPGAADTEDTGSAGGGAAAGPEGSAP